MKIIIADTYDNNIYNNKFPKKFKNYKIIWNMREALLVLWEGKVTHVAIPELGTPGYDFENFVENLIKIKQISIKPQFEYYKMNIG